MSGFRRELTQDDLIRAKIPVRHWEASFSGVQESAREHAQKYLMGVESMAQRGIGLLLWGPNGIGKTSLSVVIGKELRRRGYSLLFLECSTIKSSVIQNEMFDEEQSVWDRAKSVDVLILDDLGKGVQDSTGFGARVVDDLIRHRNANRRITFITTNMTVKALEEELKPSTMHSLKECIYPVKLLGSDLREGSKEEIRDTLS
jgi:DNA replication protein DnaC